MQNRVCFFCAIQIKNCEYEFIFEYYKKKSALAGNRTRVARVASEHSTTEPPVLDAKTYENASRLGHVHYNYARTDGSMVECSPPTRVTRVRFPVSAKWIFLKKSFLYFNVNLQVQ